MAARRTRRKKQRYREFVAEAEDLLERMREALADLGDQAGSGSEADPDLVNQLFRSAHSLKGLSGMFGLDAVGELAHHLEDVLDGLRMGRMRFESSVVEALEESVALVGSVLEGLDGEGLAEEQTESIAALITRLGALGGSASEEGSEIAGLSLDPTLLRALTEYEEHRLRENLARGRYVHAVEASFEILSFEESLAELSTELRNHGELLSTLPSPGEAPESQIRFRVLVATDSDAESLRGVLGDLALDVTPLGGGPSAPPEAGSPAPAPAEETVPETRAEAAEAVPVRRDESLRSISQTVRVDVSKLDALMNLVGEVVMQRVAIGDVVARLQQDSATAPVGAELSKIHKALERKLQELQAGVLEVRMVPLRQIFEKLSRVVRRLKRAAGKEARLEVRGADTELDKLIVEELVDPLMHLVRNSFDHGIETRAERQAAGKPAEGVIRLEAYQRGNHVVIELSDDGRGIDVDAVRARAESVGLVEPGEELSRRETLELIFAPGLSTRSEVTSTSGRGVGMDVVRANLNAMGGIVEVRSEPGAGTSISLTLPITLAIVQALMVGVADQRFAIPLNSVLEVILVEPEEIQRSEHRELLNLRGEPLSLHWLAREFGLADPDPTAKRYVVVLGLGENRLGLVVDRLLGQHDTVIKAIQGPVAQVPGVAGATELGDGGPVLVVDVAALADDGLRRRKAS